MRFLSCFFDRASVEKEDNVADEGPRPVSGSDQQEVIPLAVEREAVSPPGSKANLANQRVIGNSSRRPRSNRDPLGQHPGCRYRKVADLNLGTSAFVQLAEDVHTQQLVAIKFLARGKKLIKDADREICNLRLCSMHPYIIRFKEVFLTDRYLAIVSEYASMGDLADYIDERRSRGKPPRGLSEQEARKLFQQFMIAVDFCHQKGIVNRDLKLENLLLTPSTDQGMAGAPTIKLCDFGFSKDETIDSICKTACGTPEYVAPEVLITNQYSGRAADMWSSGVILYVMLTGRFPFKEAGEDSLPQQNKLKAMFPRIAKADFQRPTWVSLSCCNLLNGMLQPDPDKRLTVQGVMAHPWFQPGLPKGAMELNANLLRVSDLMLTSFVAQTEDDILSIVTEALHVPRQSVSANRAPSAASLRLASHPSLQGTMLQPAKGAGEVPGEPQALPRRWTLDSAHETGGQRFKPFVPNASYASSQASAGYAGSTDGRAASSHSSSIPDITSYDDLYADGHILASSANIPTAPGVPQPPHRPPSTGSHGSLRDAGWSVRDADRSNNSSSSNLPSFSDAALAPPPHPENEARNAEPNDESQHQQRSQAKLAPEFHGQQQNENPNAQNLQEAHPSQPDSAITMHSAVNTPQTHGPRMQTFSHAPSQPQPAHAPDIKGAAQPGGDATLVESQEAAPKPAPAAHSFIGSLWARRRNVQSAPSPQKAAPSNPSGATLQPRAASGAYEDARPPDEQGREEDLVASIAKSMQPKGLERAKTAGLSSELRYELAKAEAPVVELQPVDPAENLAEAAVKLGPVKVMPVAGKDTHESAAVPGCSTPDICAPKKAAGSFT